DGGNDLATVSGVGLSPSSSLFIDGGTGVNTLRVNAQGTSADTSVPNLVTFGNGAAFTYANFQSIDVLVDNTPPVIVPTPPLFIAAPGTPLIDAVVGTFTDADSFSTATEYLATIDWGDGSLPTAGTVAADPSVPGRFIVSGSHTYSGNGPFTTTIT